MCAWDISRQVPTFSIMSLTFIYYFLVQNFLLLFFHSSFSVPHKLHCGLLEERQGVTGKCRCKFSRHFEKETQTPSFMILLVIAVTWTLFFCGQLLEKNTIFWSIRTCYFCFYKFPTQCYFWHKLSWYFILRQTQSKPYTSCEFQGESKMSMLTYEN